MGCLVQLSDHIKCNECVQCSKKKVICLFYSAGDFISVILSVLIFYDRVLHFENERTGSGLKHFLLYVATVQFICAMSEDIVSKSCWQSENREISIERIFYLKCLRHKWSSKAFSICSTEMFVWWNCLIVRKFFCAFFFFFYYQPLYFDHLQLNYYS